MACKFCGSETSLILDFGEMALAGGFLETRQIPNEKKYPLKLMFCPDCYAVQLDDQIDAKTLFSDYFYFSSQINAVKRHFDYYATGIELRCNTDTVLEIGCNDGYLLGLFANRSSKCIGVDPAKNVIESINDDRLTLFNEFFTDDLAERIVKEHGKQKLVLANNVFAHVPDINGLTDAIYKVLDDDGILIIETQHLGEMIDKLQYDWIYHEHLYYYSVTSLSKHLRRHGLQIFDAHRINTHGGSIRYYICKTLAKPVSRNVSFLTQHEWAAGLHLEKTFADFAEGVKTHRDALFNTVEGIVKENGRISAYGASGRANTLLQYSGLDGRHIAQIIDDAPAKNGYQTPGTHITILHPSSEKVQDYSYTLILAWPYAKDILKKVSGKKIIPLPRIRIIHD